MARAFVTEIYGSRTPETPSGQFSFEISVVFFDADAAVVSLQPVGLSLILTDADTPATLATKVAQAIRDYATSMGFAVPANNILVPSYTTLA